MGTPSLFREYIEILWRRWWWFVTAIVGGAWLIADLSVHVFGYHLTTPRWFPLLAFGVGAIVAQFFAFVEMRRERNDALAKRSVGRRLDAVARTKMLRRLREDIPLRKQFYAEGRQMEFGIFRTLGALDAEPLALDFQAVLRQAGFKVANHTHAAITLDEVEFGDLPDVKGVCVMLNKDGWLYGQWPDFPQLLLDALRDAGIEAEFAKSSHSEVAIVIGPEA